MLKLPARQPTAPLSRRQSSRRLLHRIPFAPKPNRSAQPPKLNASSSSAPSTIPEEEERPPTPSSSPDPVDPPVASDELSSRSDSDSPSPSGKSYTTRIEAAVSQSDFTPLFFAAEKMSPADQLLLLQRVSTIFGVRSQVEKLNVQKGFCRVSELLLIGPGKKQRPAPDTTIEVVRCIGAFKPFVEPLKAVAKALSPLDSALSAFPEPLPSDCIEILYSEPLLYSYGTLRALLATLAASPSLPELQPPPRLLSVQDVQSIDENSARARIAVPLLLTFGEQFFKGRDAKFIADTWVPEVDRFARENLLTCAQMARLIILFERWNIAPKLHRNLNQKFTDSILAQIESTSAGIGLPTSTRPSDLLSAALSGLDPIPSPDEVPTTEQIIGALAAFAKFRQWRALEVLLPSLRDLLFLGGLARSSPLTPRDATALSAILDVLTIHGEQINTSTPAPSPSPSPSPSNGGRGSDSPSTSGPPSPGPGPTKILEMDRGFWIQVLEAAVQDFTSSKDRSIEDHLLLLQKLARVEGELAEGPRSAAAADRDPLNPRSALTLLQFDQLRSDLRIQAALVFRNLQNNNAAWAQLRKSADITMGLDLLILSSRLGVDLNLDLQRQFDDMVRPGRLTKLSASRLIDLLEALTNFNSDDVLGSAADNVCFRLKNMSPQLNSTEVARAMLQLSILAAVSAKEKLVKCGWLWECWHELAMNLKKMRTEDGDRDGCIYRACLYLTCSINATTSERIGKALGAVPRKWLVVSTGQWLTKLQRSQAQELHPIDSEVYQEFLALSEFEAKGEFRCKDRTLACGDIVISAISVWRRGAQRQLTVTVARPEAYLVTASGPNRGGSVRSAVRRAPETLVSQLVFEEHGWSTLLINEREWMQARLQDAKKRRAFLKNLCLASGR